MLRKESIPLDPDLTADDKSRIWDEVIQHMNRIDMQRWRYVGHYLEGRVVKHEYSLWVVVVMEDRFGVGWG